MATLIDVAKAANVSVATVSRHINRKGYISPQIKKRVRKAIHELDYKPNLVARSLKLKRSKTIGLVFPSIEDPFFSFVISKAEQVANDHDYSVILCVTEYDLEKEKMYLSVLKDRFIDGYLILPANTVDPDHYKVLEGDKVVFVDQSPGVAQEVCVKIDNVEGVKKGVEYLFECGHTRIGFINLPLEMTTGFERFEGVKKAYTDHNLPLNSNYIKFSDSQLRVEDGYKQTIELLNAPDRPTAIFPMNGPLTIGALKAIKEMRLKIPDEISIIGFDDHVFAGLLDPPLTVVAQPVCDLGIIAMETLIGNIRTKRIEPAKTILSAKLIIRNSCKIIN